MNDKMKKVLEAIEALKVVFPPPRTRSDYAEQAALFDLYEAANAILAAPPSSTQKVRDEWTWPRRLWMDLDIERRHMNEREQLFEDWWNRDGKFIDPDFSDIPWFDKRKGLAAAAFDAAMDMSRNYVADDATAPDQFTFANGRIVTLADDGSCLRIGDADHKPRR